MVGILWPAIYAKARKAATTGGHAAGEMLILMRCTDRKPRDPMRYASLDQFLKEGAKVLAKGPVAIVLAEDAVEVDTTLQHNLDAGFVQVILLAHDGIPLSPELEAQGPPRHL